MVELIGVPFDLCGARVGSRLGPAAVRLGGLQENLAKVGVSVHDASDIAVEGAKTVDGGLKNFEPVFDCAKKLKTAVTSAISSGRTPLVLGGGHSLSIGSVAGALAAFGTDLALLWVDAHTDLNTPSTTPSGNLHGMPVASLMGLPSGVTGLQDLQWSRMVAEVVGSAHLMSSRTSWFGIRDVDDGEKDHLSVIDGEYKATMYDIDRNGVVGMLDGFDRWLRASGATKLWISFDVDVLDPILAPGTGTAVRGGLTYREMHLMGEYLNELMGAKDCPYQLCGLDLVEVNPLFDTNNETGRVAVEWIASLFGKTILGRR